VSGSRAPFVSTAAATAAGTTSDRFMQAALGGDAEYSRSHYVLRVEVVDGHFSLATIEPRLDAVATSVEGRYKLTPRVHVAARADHLAFNTITGTARTISWEAPVTRWEVGAGYAVQRNLQAKVAYQYNTRDGGRVRTLHAVAAQLLYWF
jgi:predicted porin